ncbi:hypothetical protein CTAM01_00830 [Colletotrichum tamarilloi]|uniref:Uncharacterized protein n=1 Tax=Colletotrichum tamarilloi TaxID=1209934 RepID=A0ABQ9RSA6_9PEZI|nr:uncharacterized protein CTAM01_00830 [Colletotrichum tamarilloi]KAK1511900.1 hypothetical protein CTAM01_00830 [Colletotrichum tamarilloi]
MLSPLIVQELVTYLLTLCHHRRKERCQSHRITELRINRHNPESHWRTEAGKHRRDDNLLPPVIYATGYHPSPVPNAALQLSVAESSHDAAKQPTQARFYTDRAASLQYLPVYAPVAASTMSFGWRVLEQTPSLTSGCSRGTAAAAAAAATSREALSSLLAHSTYTTTRRHDDTTTR